MKLYLDTKLAKIEGNQAWLLREGGWEIFYDLTWWSRPWWGCDKCFGGRFYNAGEQSCNCNLPRPDDWKLYSKSFELFAGRIVCIEE